MENYNFDNPYQLPTSAAAVMPQELGTDFFASLDKALQLQEKGASENIYGDMESRGLLNSGINTREITDKVLGPGLQRRQQAFLPFAFNAAATGQSQRFQKEQQHQQFLDQLETMREQNLLTMRLMNFQQQLSQQAPRSKPTFGDMFESNFASGLGSLLGKAAPQAGFGALGGGMQKLRSMGGGGGGYDAYANSPDLFGSSMMMA